MDNNVDDYTMAVATILTREKERTGLSFSKIAELTGIGRATVVRVLAGERPITTYYLHQLAQVFGISPGSVLAEADELEVSPELNATTKGHYDLVANDSIDETYDTPDSDFDNA